jgi:hypothetical protein
MVRYLDAVRWRSYASCSMPHRLQRLVDGDRQRADVIWLRDVLGAHQLASRVEILTNDVVDPMSRG